MFAVARPHTTDRPATVTAASASLGLLAVLAIPTMILASDGVDPRFFGLGATFATLKLIARSLGQRLGQRLKADRLRSLAALVRLRVECHAHAVV